jgi:hypothetical protein
MMNEAIDHIMSFFRTPSAEMLAVRELEEAKRRLLHYQTTAEYAESMCRYNRDRIQRLTNYLATVHGTK